MSGWGQRAVSLGVLLCASTALATVANAQSYSSVPAPPIHRMIDANGVDLVNGTLNISGGSVSVGPAAGGLTFQYLAYGSAARSVFGGISCSGSTCAVSIGASTENFTLSGNTWVPAEGQSSTLTGGVGTGAFTYTAADGTVAQFSQGTSLTPFVATTSVLSTLTRPSGEVLTYAYLFGSFCGGNTEGGCAEYVPSARPQSISSSRGYQLHFSYATDSLSSGAFVQLTKIVAINSSVDYCNPTADSCAALTQTWPTITFSNSGETVTDAANRVTSSNGALLTRPSGATLTQTPTANGFTLSNGVGTWTYTETTSGTTATWTVTDPLGHTRTVASNTSIDQPISDTDGLGNKTSYQYDSTGRVTQITYPEGNYTQYVYDNGVAGGRGNVTQTTQVAKSGSGLANIVTSASYDATCIYQVKCNEPNSTTDALGNVTNYTYSTVHGGVLTVTGPAAPNGVHPTVVYSYGQVATYSKNSGGALVQSGTIWVPTETASCATSTPSVTATSTTATLSCSAGASDAVIKTMSYAGSNNAQPTSVTSGAGDGSLAATTSTTYNIVGDPVSVQGPLGASQTVTYVYDAIRRPIGLIGPDPDGSGPLLPRAVSTTYSPDGLPTSIAEGTVTSASSWSSFSALATESIGYDSIDRKITDSLVSGGATQTLTQYTYDAANRLTCTAVRMNASAFASLPASACTLGTQGSYGPDMITYDTYDSDNRILQVTDGYGVSGQQRNAETVSYSANGDQLTAADAKGNLTISTYDGFDRLSKVQYPTPSNGSVSSTTDYQQYSYDADSHLTQVRRRDGVTVTAVFDNLGRTSSISSPATSYVYDSLGRVTSATRNSQTLTYANDALGRVTSETGVNGAMGAQYDLAGRLTRITWPDGYYVTYVNDWAGDVTQIEENGATSGVGLLASYGYNNLGERTSVTRGDGVTTSYGYDAAWRLSSLAHAFPIASNNQTITLARTPASQISGRSSSEAGLDRMWFSRASHLKKARTGTRRWA
jgi:YD repeat-containing protein